MKMVQKNQKISPYQDAEKEAADLLLSGIAEKTASDGERFIGYAPVLQAIAHVILSYHNASALISVIKKDELVFDIDCIVKNILDREHGKINKITFDDSSLTEKLYTRDQQLQYLAKKLYNSDEPLLPAMSQKDKESYLRGLNDWIDGHPFLENGIAPSSSVFEAAVIVHAMGQKNNNDIINRQLLRGESSNPFVAELCRAEFGNKGIKAPVEYIIPIYLSVRSGLSLGKSASLLIDEDDENVLTSEIVVINNNDKQETFFESGLTNQEDIVNLGGYLSDVHIDAPKWTVCIGGMAESKIIAPIYIDCDEIAVDSRTLLIGKNGNSEESAVYFRANKISHTGIISAPHLFGDVNFSVDCKNSSEFPWNSYRVNEPFRDILSIDEPLRRLRKILISFRSHSKGELARFVDKINHNRMTKGSGQKILNYLKKENIIFQRGIMYILDQGRLLEKLNLNYIQCLEYQFSDVSKKVMKEILGTQE